MCKNVSRCCGADTQNEDDTGFQEKQTSLLVLLLLEKIFLVIIKTFPHFTNHALKYNTLPKKISVGNKFITISALDGSGWDSQRILDMSGNQIRRKGPKRVREE